MMRSLIRQSRSNVSAMCRCQIMKKGQMEERDAVVTTCPLINNVTRFTIVMCTKDHFDRRRIVGLPVMGMPALGMPVMGGPVMGAPVMGVPVMGGPVMGRRIHTCQNQLDPTIVLKATTLEGSELDPEEQCQNSDASS